MKDPYETLGVVDSRRVNALTDEEIKKIYLELAKKWHPDLNHSPEAKRMFQDISQAYECLKDEPSRLRYEQSVKNQNFSSTYNGNIRYNRSSQGVPEGWAEETNEQSYRWRGSAFHNARRVGQLTVLFLLPVVGLSAVLWIVTRNNKKPFVEGRRDQKVEAWFNPL